MTYEDLYRRVWEEMLYAEMRANYFGDLVSHYQKWEKAIRVCVLAASSGAAATVLSSAPAGVKLGLPLIAAGGSFWLLFSQYSMLSRDAADLHSQWNSIETRYEKLWNNFNANDAEAVFRKIYEDADGLSKAGTKFPIDKKRLDRWLDHSAEIFKARYA
jgi:hypothetical protein